MASSSNPQTHPTPAVTTPSSSASSAVHSPAPPRPAPRDEEPARQALETRLKELTQSLYDLGLMVHDFQNESGGSQVFDKVNQVVTHFADLDKLKEGISSLYVPEEVVKYVEEARNPDIFTQGFVERAAAENQFTNGKIRAIESFRSILVTELTTSFPDLAPALSPASANPSLNGIATTANPPPPLHANGASSSASPASSMSTTASPAGGINGRH